jgi:hypothetical protein
LWISLSDNGSRFIRTVSAGTPATVRATSPSATNRLIRLNAGVALTV